jgi:AcrR family transcriptional regulator
VPSDRTSAGDPAKTLALLWGPPSTVRSGPQRGLRVDAVVAAATTLADEDGLAALSMRAVAERLGVSAMTLYTYVPGKAELLDLMLDAAYQRLPLADSSGQPWRARLTHVADENRELYLRHPWASAVSTLRPPLGPGLMAKYEHELAAFAGLGLTDLQIDDSLTFLLTFVQASARAAVDSRTAALESAMTDAQWWTANESLLSRVFDEGTYPLAVRVGSAAGAAHGSAHDPDHAYQFGLQRLLDGLATLIDPAD